MLNFIWIGKELFVYSCIPDQHLSTTFQSGFSTMKYNFYINVSSVHFDQVLKVSDEFATEADAREYFRLLLEEIQNQGLKVEMMDTEGAWIQNEFMLMVNAFEHSDEIETVTIEQAKTMVDHDLDLIKSFIEHASETVLEKISEIISEM